MSCLRSASNCGWFGWKLRKYAAGSERMARRPITSAGFGRNSLGSRFLVRLWGLMRPPRASLAYSITAALIWSSAAANCTPASGATRLTPVIGGTEPIVVGLGDLGRDGLAARGQTALVDPQEAPIRHRIILGKRDLLGRVTHGLGSELVLDGDSDRFRLGDELGRALRLRRERGQAD